MNRGASWDTIQSSSGCKPNKKNETEEMKLPGNVIYIGQWITTEFQPLAKGNFLRVQLVMHQPQN